MYTRKCPKCGKDIIYLSYVGHWIAKKKKSSCRSCSSTEMNNRPKIKKLRTLFFRRYAKTHINGFEGKKHSKETLEKLKLIDKAYTKTKKFRKKMSIANKGNNNPMYGVTFYEKWLKKYGKKTADQKLDDFRKRQSINSSGIKNSMYGKISPHGAGNGWSGWYKKWYFRSLLELSYMINVIEANHKKWRSAETKDLAITYTNWDGRPRTYRADFLIDNKYLVECKPIKLFNTPTNKLKRKAAEEFCRKRGMVYRIEDAPKLTGNQIIGLYNKKKIKFIKIYDKRFRERYLDKKNSINNT